MAFLPRVNVALLVLVQGRHLLAAGLLGVIFVIGPMWFAPRGQLLELQHNGWEAPRACRMSLSA